MELSRRAQAIADSVTLAIDAKAKAMAAQGVDIVGFGAGEPDFNTPEFICRAAKKAIDKGKTRYTPVAGTLSLRKAICEKLARENGVSYEPGQIVVSNGAKHSLFNTFQVLLNPGDEVIIPAPYWVSYPELVKLAGGVPVFVETREESDFCLNTEDLKAAITPRTKALVLCNPSNPTGSVYSRELLEDIAGIAVEHDFFVVADEIYEQLVYGAAKAYSIASLGEEMKKRTVLINGASKAFAMTGWRIGYAACEAPIAKLMSNLQSQATSNANSVAQYAVEAALTQQSDDVPMMVAEFDQRRKLICAGINAIPGLSCREPKGAFYVMMNITGIVGKRYNGEVIDGSMTFAKLLLDEYHVAVVPGIAFGNDGFVRLSYATGREKISEGLKRIEAFVRALA